MKVERDKVTFSTGKEIEVTLGIIGLCPDGTAWQGADSAIWSESVFNNALTPEERIELGEFMIAMWRKFIKAAGKDLKTQRHRIETNE